MTNRTLSLPRELLSQNAHMASSDLENIMDATRHTPNRVKMTPRSKPTKKKKSKDWNGSPSITPTIFKSDGLALALVSSDSKEFAGRKGGSGFQHFVNANKGVGKIKNNYQNLDRTVKLAIESRKNSPSAGGEPTNGRSTPLMHHRKSAYTMLKDEFMSNQVKKVLDYLGRLENKHKGGLRKGRNSEMEDSMPSPKNQT
mmetsp:Transcript_3871/g.5165  ORF Transcript_3871/g.5165 Transcript_3871/m.5165 type:complete len:199 (+) Transcript_3871:86-682(+)